MVAREPGGRDGRLPRGAGGEIVAASVVLIRGERAAAAHDAAPAIG